MSLLLCGVAAPPLGFAFGLGRPGEAHQVAGRVSMGRTQRYVEIPPDAGRGSVAAAMKPSGVAVVSSLPLGLCCCR